MAIVKDTPVFDAFMQEHLQYLSNLFQILHAAFGLEFKQGGGCITGCATLQG